MLPTLISWGPLVVKTINLFAILAFLVSGFIFWKKGREEHYEEDELFDGFILALIVALLFSRIGFIITHFANFSFNPLNWLDLMGHPGLSGLFGGIGGTIFIYRFAQQKKWDAFEILDFWVTSLAISLSIISVGLFFDGSGYGYATNLPWGFIFPGVFEKHHPVQLYAAFLYFLLFIYLIKLEYKYRTFVWYKAKRKSAQTGFLFGFFLMGMGIFELLLSLVTPSQLKFYVVDLDILIAILVSLIGLFVLLIRAGRIPFWGQK